MNLFLVTGSRWRSILITTVKSCFYSRGNTVIKFISIKKTCHEEIIRVRSGISLSTFIHKRNILHFEYLSVHSANTQTSKVKVIHTSIYLQAVTLSITASSACIICQHKLINNSSLRELLHW